MNPMSEEQRRVLDHIRAGHNVVVDACAGSGKSTTILSIAKELTGKQIMQWTYNAMLRKEIKEKIHELELTNLQVHTYHSFAVKHYSNIGCVDTGIRQIISEERPLQKPLPAIDILVLDECQDMTPLYFQLIVKMTKDMHTLYPEHRFQILVLGDYMQGLYEFKGADIRFLTLADQIWKGHPCLQTPTFAKCTLQMSYRITNQMAQFVNRDMLGEPRMRACRNGCPVVYIRRPRHQINQIVLYQIKRLLAEGESPSDIFVLGGSIKGTSSHIRHLENMLTENDIPCHVPMFETDIADERVIDGKIVFSTFHTVKGRQRKYVFVVGFDQGYFYTARNIPTDVCPNTLYVACTRATHALYLLENDHSRPLEFLKQSQHQMKESDYIDFKGIPQTIFRSCQNVQDPSIVLIPTYHVNPSELIKFVSEETLDYITPILKEIFVQEEGEQAEIDIPKIQLTRGSMFEEVSDLNGIAIPAMIYDAVCPEHKRGADVLLNMIQQSVQELKENTHSYLKKKVRELPEVFQTTADYLYLANVFKAMQEKLYSKLHQMDRYDWITDEQFNKCKTRVMEHLGEDVQDPKTEVEKTLIHYVHEQEHAALDNTLAPYFGYETRFRFNARVDLITQTSMWEIKCTSKITLDHMIQVVLYAWILHYVEPQCPRTTRLYNIRNGEKWVLRGTADQYTKIVAALLRGKYMKQDAIQNETFLENQMAYIEGLL